MSDILDNLRQDIKNCEFDFISCLIESGYFQICELDYYTLSCEDQLYIQTQEIEHTKENADKLIQIAELFKEIR